MHDLALPSDAFRLGPLVVVPSLNRIVRDGEPVDVEPRVMGVLAALAETPGEVVGRAALFDAVWSDAVVNDEALTRAVSELRKALGEEGRGAVETIRGTGYRLAVPVRPVRAATEDRGPAGRPRPTPPRPVPGGRGGALAGVALAVAVVALAVSLWAVGRRATPKAAGQPVERTRADRPALVADEPFRLDSTSQYYVPGLSTWGVYHDSSTGRYFRFEPDAD